MGGWGEVQAIDNARPALLAVGDAGCGRVLGDAVGDAVNGQFVVDVGLEGHGALIPCIQWILKSLLSRNYSHCEAAGAAEAIPFTGWEIASPPLAARNDAGGYLRYFFFFSFLFRGNDQAVDLLPDFLCR